MKTLKQACIPRASMFDPTRRNTVLDLSDLIDGRIDPDEFFSENHITEGMEPPTGRPLYCLTFAGPNETGARIAQNVLKQGTRRTR